MRDLVFKNIACPEKKRRIIASSEVADSQGVRSIIRRHFVCIAREAKDNMIEPAPYLYILKERNTNEHRERFFCRIKGSAQAVIENRLFLILFAHSLSIDLTSIPQDAAK